MVPVMEASCRSLVSWLRLVSTLFCVSMDVINTAATRSIEIKTKATTLLSMPPITRRLNLFNGYHPVFFGFVQNRPSFFFGKPAVSMFADSAYAAFFYFPFFIQDGWG